jgi:hypothetical protein
MRACDDGDAGAELARRLNDHAALKTLGDCYQQLRARGLPARGGWDGLIGADATAEGRAATG